MNRASHRDVPAAWGSTSDVRSSTPSWLAPPSESQVLPVSPAVGPPLATDIDPVPGAQTVSVSDNDATSEPQPNAADESAARCVELQAENDSLRLELRAQLDVLASIRTAVMASAELELVRLAGAIAARVLRREVRLDPAVVIGWAREAAESLAAGETLTLACAPDLARVVTAAEFRAAIAALGRVEVDVGLPSMACEVRQQASHVDASWESRLAAVVDEVEAGDA